MLILDTSGFYKGIFDLHEENEEGRFFYLKNIYGYSGSAMFSRLIFVALVFALLYRCMVVLLDFYEQRRKKKKMKKKSRKE